MDGTKSARWNVRVTRGQDAIVRAALDRSGESLNDFIARHAVAAAQDELADRRVFILDDAAWTELQLTLGRPARRIAELGKLMGQPSVLEGA